MKFKGVLLCGKSSKGKWIFSVIAGILTVIAVCANGNTSTQTSFLGKLKEEMSGSSIAYLIVAVAIFVLYFKVYDLYRENNSIVGHVLAALFALTMLIGLSYSKNGNWSFIFHGEKQLLIAVLIFAGFYIISDVVITLLFIKMDAVSVKDLSSKRPVIKWIDNHFFIFAFLIIILLWSPYLITHLPGSVTFDGARQIGMYLGTEEFTKHHPWFVTYIYGALFSLGSSVSDNFGVFLVVILFFILEALLYAEISTKLKSFGNNLVIGFLSLGFFAILPAFGAYAQVIVKDGIYTALFALFIVWCMDIYFSDIEQVSGKKLAFKIIRLFFVGLLVCLTRNNGIYLILPETFILIFLFRKK